MANWQLDPYHTQVEFSARHLGMMKVRGHFTEISTKGEVDPDYPEKSWVEVTIQAASSRTDNETRDSDVRSSNFLDVEHHPTITFKSTNVETAGADRYRLTGDLTIRGTSRSVTLDVTRYGELTDQMLGHRVAYSAQTKINRKDFGLTFNMMLDGRWVVSEEVEIMIEGELVEEKEPSHATAP